MENIVNISTFVHYLTYYIKMGIFINKGTDKDDILEKTIKLYNKYKSIENNKNISDKDETLVRKCSKRLNLILKIDDKNEPINIRNKENQTRMIHLDPHPSLLNGNFE